MRRPEGLNDLVYYTLGLLEEVVREYYFVVVDDPLRRQIVGILESRIEYPELRVFVFFGFEILQPRFAETFFFIFLICRSQSPQVGVGVLLQTGMFGLLVGLFLRVLLLLFLLGRLLQMVLLTPVGLLGEVVFSELFRAFEAVSRQLLLRKAATYSYDLTFFHSFYICFRNIGREVHGQLIARAQYLQELVQLLRGALISVQQELIGELPKGIRFILVIVNQEEGVWIRQVVLLQKVLLQIAQRLCRLKIR